MSKEPKEKKLRLISRETGDFTPKAEAAFEEIFKRFDADSDGVLNEKELDDFAIACNGEPFDANSKAELRNAFDTDEKEQLTLKGFFEMYHTQSSAEPSESWKDLNKLGYDSQLNLAKK
eukprot:TRINITY_DN468_c0_g1_i1.p1 TRINITY_DN468_c0_g1~~TRINITY_DN468_c0_g1_i1.p1  ORF type:complete len:119 (-),score=31.89 TRINITY_DN468_c0_g1_i1:81-437(-)